MNGRIFSEEPDFIAMHTQIISLASQTSISNRSFIVYCTNLNFKSYSDVGAHSKMLAQIESP